MPIAILWSNSRLVNGMLVNGLPWSVLHMSGFPCRARSRCHRRAAAPSPGLAALAVVIRSPRQQANEGLSCARPNETIEQGRQQNLQARHEQGFQFFATRHDLGRVAYRLFDPIRDARGTRG